MWINLKKNMEYNLFIKPSTQKYLIKLSKKNKKDFKEILNKIKLLKFDPYNSNLFKTSDDKKRKVRKGKYRIIFKIIEEKNPPVLEIIRIGKRSSIYKK